MSHVWDFCEKNRPSYKAEAASRVALRLVTERYGNVGGAKSCRVYPPFLKSRSSRLRH